MEHKLSCGVVVVHKSDAGWETILLRAFHHWDFPKGLREPGEEPLQAALREVGEETGIDDLEFDWGDRYFETGPYSRGKVARYFIAKTRQEAVEMGLSPETGQPEHQARAAKIYVTVSQHQRSTDLGEPAETIALSTTTRM